MLLVKTETWWGNKSIVPRLLLDELVRIEGGNTPHGSNQRRRMQALDASSLAIRYSYPSFELQVPRANSKAPGNFLCDSGVNSQ